MVRVIRQLSVMMPLFLFLVSCNGVLNNNKDNVAPDGENTSTSNEVILDSFTRTKFRSRADELIYIREYIKYKLPLVLIKIEPDRMEIAQQRLIGKGMDVSLEEATEYTFDYEQEYHFLWTFITKHNLSIDDVKEKLNSYEASKGYNEWEEKTTKDNKVLPVIKEENEVELPPLIEEKKNIKEQRIYGDFNGDGAFEYAYRALIKKDIGNPVEGGSLDEYQIQFSDKNIRPVKVGCCAFKLIFEGDLNNDGADELSIVQSPMNGCIGSFRTFTCKNGNCFELFEPFTFYSCNQVSKQELEDLVTSENRGVYYREIDQNGEGLIKKRATLKI